MSKPEFLKKGATIGLCAPSFGCATSPYVERYHNAVKTFKKLGYKIIEGKNVTSYDDIASAPAEERAKAYVKLLSAELAKRGLYQDILTKDYIANLCKAAPMHDIGKIGVPDLVLQKPGKLNDEEYEIIKKFLF